jgi:outer membrane lipoprotein SlyB
MNRFLWGEWVAVQNKRRILGAGEGCFNRSRQAAGSRRTDGRGRIEKFPPGTLAGTHTDLENRVMIRPALLLTLAFASAAALADPLVDLFNAEKARIADTYKAAVRACDQKSGREHGQCRKNAEAARRDALKAASAERDVGLKCKECGVVVAVSQSEEDGKASATGTVVGGVAGAVIGRELAGDTSSANKNVATAAGGVAGALIGRKIEEKMKKRTVWRVEVQAYGQADKITVTFDQNPGFKPGDKVKLGEDGKLQKR